jgi:hypothetical protein
LSPKNKFLLNRNRQPRVARAVARATITAVTTVAVLTAAVAAVLGDDCDNSNDGSGLDGGSNDGDCGDGECDGGSSGYGVRDDSGEAMKTTAATAMAVGGNTTINWKGDDRNSDGDGNGDGYRQRQ